MVHQADDQPFWKRPAVDICGAYSVVMIAFRRGVVAACLAAVSGACPRATHEPEILSGGTRSYLMGFSVVPPRPDVKVAIQSMEIWTRRADAAIMHLDVPWAPLLAGTSASDALRKDGVDLEHYYRSKHLKLVVTIDVTNGLARESEATANEERHDSPPFGCGFVYK